MSDIVTSTARQAPSTAQAPVHTRSLLRQLLWIVVVALVLRVAGVFLLHSYRVKLGQDESARIAASLVSGEGFSNPFGGVTGPTAWLGPVYPFVLAGIFKLFGIYTRASSFAALFLNCVLSALTCIPVYFIGRWSFGPRVAKWSAWTWTLLPYTMYWGIKWVWDTALSALLFATLFMLTLELARAANLSAPTDENRVCRGPLWKWLLWGLLWGIAGLTNTAELAFLPFAGLWVVWQYFRRRQPFLRQVVAAAVVFLAVLTPWMVRNHRVFHKLIPVRGNFGVEFHLGNTIDARGMWQVWLHPTQNVLEFDRYQRMGEVAYVQQKKQQTLAFLREHPGKFATLTVEHFIYYWAGAPHAEKWPWLQDVKSSMFLLSSILAIWGVIMAWRRRRPAAGLFALMLVTYPDVYYITFPHARYRHPLEPMMLVLAVYLISETRRTPMDYPKELSSS
jgi:4-amino-4-deoxy-L-arabinose transferase-like glycosyltransferase